MAAMRLARVSLALTFILGTSCSADVGAPRVALGDPLDLIDDVQGPLRLFVLRAEEFTCDDATGTVSPEVPDVEEGMFGQAVADLSLTVEASTASAQVDVPGGDYVVYVRGKGTDPVSMRTDVFIATGCTAATIAAGETREVRLTLNPILGEGVCGDGTLSPDEQCEDTNTADGDGCSASCRTEPIAVNTTTSGVQNHPSVAGAIGRRWTVAYESEASAAIVRLLEADGTTVTTPSVLMSDSDIDPIFGFGLGTRIGGRVSMASDGRIGLSFIDFPGPDIRVGFFDQNRASEGGTEIVSDNAGEEPRIAFAGDGAAMVVFQDAASATGVMGQVFAAGSATPASGMPFEVGGGLSGAAAPQVAGLPDGFVVVAAAGGGVHAQRFESDGTPRDAAAVLVDDEAGIQDQPDVAALADGSFLVVWRDETLDGAGTGIGGRAYGTDGAPLGEAFALNSTTAGDQSLPAAAAGGDAYAVAYVSGGSARARMLSADGSFRFNRESPPNNLDFEVSPSASEVDVAVGGPSAAELRWMAVTNEADDIVARLYPMP